jgi:tetratricopeptide (TPR) repeat protein
MWKTTIKLMVKKMKQSILILSLLSIALILTAQKKSYTLENEIKCIVYNFSNASAAYQAGLYFDCIKTLEEALDSCDYSRKEKERVLELLAKAYVETGNKDKAEATVNILLKNYPHYEFKSSENPEGFIRLVNKYRIHPLFTLGAKNTANWLRHKTIKSYSVLPALDYSNSYSESGYWFTYYAMAEYEFVKDISINIDGMIFWSRYGRDFTKDPSFSLSYWESDDFMEIPIYLKKYFHPAGNFLVYASAGFGPFINYRAKGNVTLSYKKADILTTGKDDDFDGGLYNINMLPIKNKITGQWNVGAGFGYTIKNLRLFLDARYLSGTGSVTAPEKSDLIPELKNDFFYIDQEMKINQFEVGATISYTLFNSVKRKKIK